MDLNPTDINVTPLDPEEEAQTTATPAEQTDPAETAATPEDTPPAPEEPTEPDVPEPVEESPQEEAQEEEQPKDDTDEKADLSRLSGEELYQALLRLTEEGTAPSQRDMRRLERDMMPTRSSEGEEQELPSEEADAAARFINLQTRVQELRKDLRDKERSEREENLRLKRELVERLKELFSPTNTMNPITLRNEFFNIRHSWSEVGRVPDNERNALMEEYSGLLDRFYEEKEIGEGERLQDYAENRALKEELIRKARALSEEKDAVKAFRKMKGLLDEWKEVGPVAPEFKESLRKDFKDAEQAVNRRHDDHFKALHEDEKANYEKKKELVETLEKMLVTLPTTRQAWRRYESDLKRIHSKWMSIGRVPKDLFIELRSRYDLVRDEFYMQRKAFLKDLSAEISPKLERLREVVAEAEALQDSEEWSATTEKFKRLQAEWTENSRLGTQVGEAQRLWKRFRNACDKFFTRKADMHKQRVADRKENLQAKYDIVDRLEELLRRRGDPDVAEQVKALEEEWRSIGPVPNDEKDDVLNRYFGAMRVLQGRGERRGGGDRDRNRDRRDGDRGDRRGGAGRRGDRRGDRRDDDRQREPKFTKVNLDKDLSKLSKDDLKDEQQNVKHGISRLEEELLQLETNFGFFSGDPDDPMVKHVRQQIDEVKAKIARYRDRVGEIKEEAKKPAEEPQPEQPADEASTDAPAPEA